MGYRIIASHLPRSIVHLFSKENTPLISYEPESEDDLWKTRRDIANSVRVKGRGVSYGVTETFNQFDIHIMPIASGEGKLKISMSGPGFMDMLHHQSCEHIQLGYCTKEPGEYTMEMTYEDIHIPGSPFTIQIKKPECFPHKVVAKGKGLTKCRQGEKAEFRVNTSKAGLGNFSATVNGRTHCPVVVFETKRGYLVQYHPNTPGFYDIKLKYNNQHVPGSPFIAVCKATETQLPFGYGLGSFVPGYEGLDSQERPGWFHRIFQ